MEHSVHKFRFEITLTQNVFWSQDLWTIGSLQPYALLPPKKSD